MRWFVFVAVFLAGSQARADADYPVYACDGPFLRMVSPGGLSLVEVWAQFPMLREPEPMEFYVFQDGDTVSWTDLNRDELRAMCLDRVDRAQAPQSGRWAMDIAPFDPNGCTAPPPTDMMIGPFPRALAFGDVFHPMDILNSAEITWQLDRYPEDLMWGAYGGQRDGVTGYRGLAVTFVAVSPQAIEIDLYVETADRCHANYSIFLNRVDS